jgi:hypothetical protein
MLPTATSLEGKRVPNVTFKTRSNDQWKDVTTDDVFKHRTVVVFSLPGAYTPTCSSTHLVIGPAALDCGHLDQAVLCRRICDRFRLSIDCLMTEV